MSQVFNFPVEILPILTYDLASTYQGTNKSLQLVGVIYISNPKIQ
jgi:hypothetical protein